MYIRVYICVYTYHNACVHTQKDFFCVFFLIFIITYTNRKKKQATKTKYNVLFIFVFLLQYMTFCLFVHSLPACWSKCGSIYGVVGEALVVNILIFFFAKVPIHRNTHAMHTYTKTERIYSVWFLIKSRKLFLFLQFILKIFFGVCFGLHENIECLATSS